MRRTLTQSNIRGGFTIVEILVVVALILVLLSLVIVAVGSATRTAQRTNTGALMSNIKQALVHFENDVGYLPPVLQPNRDLVWPQLTPPLTGRTNGPAPDNLATFQTEIQNWWSVTTLAEFLVGYGPEGEDGHNGPGIRNPGPDGYWGATNPVLSNPGTFTARAGWLDPAGTYISQSQSYRQGRIFGPYLQLRDDRLLGAINPDVGPDASGRFQVFFPGEAGYNDMWPKVIVDYWGEAIRYYRKPYPQGGINRGYRQVRGQEFDVPTLADVYLLRPWTVGQSDIDTRFADQNPTFVDQTASTNLLNAEFALFSSGPSRRFDQTRRVDDDDFNQDNIVELGP